MNYTNVLPDGDGYKYRVMIAREFLERGGFTTPEEAAWECDKVRLWASDLKLVGRKVPYNFPERILNISDSENENRPPQVSQFLNRLSQQRGTEMDFVSPEEDAKNRSATLGFRADPEVRAAQLDALSQLCESTDGIIAVIIKSKFSPTERDAMVKKANALRNEIVEAATRRS